MSLLLDDAENGCFMVHIPARGRHNLADVLAAYCAAGRRLPCALLCGLVYFAVLLLVNMLVISEGFTLTKLAAVGAAVLLSSLVGGIISAWLPHKRKKH